MAISKNSAPLQITYRSHHNAYKEGDGSGARVIYNPEPQGVGYKVLQILYGLFIIHYFLWIIPMLIILWLPYYFSYPMVSLMLLGMYSRTYFKADELKLGRVWEGFRQFWTWTLMHHYAGLEVVREVELDPERRYIFGYHPHGILILSRSSTYGGLWEVLFPGIQNRCLGATPMFNLPGSREICLWVGAVRADKSNAVQILSTSKLSLLLYPGGSDEIFETDPDSSETVIIARKGFIKLALQQGCDLVPSFVFGEKHSYHKLEIPQGIKNFFMKKLRTPLIIFWGRWFTWLPLNGKKAFLSVVYGMPIRTEKIIPEPSDKEIDEVYERFYGEIRNLYEKYKTRYGYDSKETLVIREAKSKSVKSSIPNKKEFEEGIKSEYTEQGIKTRGKSH